MALKPVKTVNGNGEVEVGLVDDEVTAPDLAGPADKSLSGFNLRPEIMKRAGEVFEEDAINNKDRPENGLLDTLIPRKGTQKGGGGKNRSTGTILDPYNLGWFGGREAVIDKIITEGGKELIESYNPQTGKYSKLPQWNQTFDGVIHDDITKGLVLRQATQRKDTPEWRALTPEQQENVGTLTKTSDIIKGAAADTKLKNTKDTIRSKENGGMWLDDYVKYELDGKAPTQSQLDTLLTEIEALQPGVIRANQEQDNSNRTTTSNIEIAEDTLQLNRDIETNRNTIAGRNATTAEGTLTLAQTKAKNELAQQQFENEDKVAYRNYQAQEADKLRAFTATENAAQRATQMEINLLGREDSREERAYDRRRDERQDRQMMIMQMMKGLQQLGGSFSI